MTLIILYVIVCFVSRIRRVSLLTLSALLADILSVIAADIASFQLRFDGTFPNNNFSAYLQLLYFIVISRIVCFYLFGNYDGMRNNTVYENFINSAKACTVSSVVIIAILYFSNIEFYPRSVALLSFIITIVFVNFWRIIAKKGAEAFFGSGYFHTRILIIGTGFHAKEVAFKASMDASAHSTIIGFITTHSCEQTEVEKDRILGSMDGLPGLVRKYAVDEVILADRNVDSYAMSDLMSMLSWEGISLKAAPDNFDNVIGNMVSSESGVLFLGLTLSAKPPPSWYWWAKRMFDIFFSISLILTTLPLTLLTGILIKITSPGPIFYLQKRTGLHGKAFIIYKFRTMQINAEKGMKPKWAKAGDVRITPLGNFLRRYRVDELPQLINILGNDMSFIGPRPERPYFTAKLMRKIPFYSQRLYVKPGLTGWAQVSYHYTDTEKGAKEKLLYDLFYTHNASLTLDLLIVLKTFKVVLTGHGAH